ncbi:hypothetical protein BSL78_26310 [Apostichopus japonicus]|uniref:Uncharacterized protein n=1 Tax=Stichopus japonicus TaxID=307972 RepID=A0A2G8JM98_STIJA|nr:hypothetical protein BSL78_26310 [Apostichopus japonicus]
MDVTKYRIRRPDIFNITNNACQIILYDEPADLSDFELNVQTDVVKLLRRASRQRPILDDNIQAPTGDGNGPRSSGRFYLKNTKNAHGKSSCAIYFDKKQIFIGDVSPENIEKDSSLAQRDPDRISVRFSSFDASTSNREYQLNLPANQNLDKPKVDLPKNFEMNDNPGTSSDSKQQSRMTTSPIFN